ncbi:MAG: AlkZ family DNA glycosylase [Euryarchaeota archaeon]|nr:AlkZ family DNA glycosylase [Euryarchaeota archaeon]
MPEGREPGGVIVEGEIYEDLNRRLLWSHCLSSRLQGRDAPMKVADACCGIQSQSIRESISSFWARTDGLSSSDLLSELKPGGGLVRTWAIRSAMHTVPSKDYYVYVLGGGAERLLNWIDTIAKKRRYPARERRRRLLYEPVLEEIKGRAVTAEEMRALVNRRARRLRLKEGIWSGVGEMAFSGLLVHAGKRGSRSLWMRSDDWIPNLGAPPGHETCRIELLRRYIARHGPVSKEDIMHWAYLSRSQVNQALRSLATELVEVRIGHSTDPYVALARDIDRDVPPSPKVTVLPKYDSLLLSLKDKSRFMDMAYYKRIFPKIPVGMVKPTVLVDGFVVATWKRVTKKTHTSIEVQPFKMLSATDKKAVERRFSEYCEHAGVDGQVRWLGNTRP